MKNSLLQIHNLSFSYDKTPLLRDLSFEIFEGEIIFVIGPNGGGKTTFVNVVLKLLDHKAGEIKLYNKEIDIKDISKYISFVPQYSLIDRSFPIKVSEILELEEVNYKRKIQNLKIFFSINKLLNKKISDLSGGEFQKILIVRSMLKNPKLLILDEPTNNLDLNSTNKLYEFLEFQKRNSEMTSIIISHDVSSISKYADKVLCLNRTESCYGKRDEILSKDKIQEIYGKHLGM